MGLIVTMTLDVCKHMVNIVWIKDMAVASQYAVTHEKNNSVGKQTSFIWKWCLVFLKWV